MKLIFVTYLFFCASARAQISGFDGLERVPATGWNSWNWIGVAGTTNNCSGNLYRCHNEETMREMTDAMVLRGFRKAGYEFINLSEGWPAECYRKKTCSGRWANGTLMWDPDRYPSGIPALVDYVHAKGFKFGIYLDAGTRTCADFPGSLGYEKVDVDTIVAWGADYLWLDGCNLDPSLYREKYELWSQLLAPHDIVYEVSWPAYVGHASADVYYDAGSFGQEFRFYLDARPNFTHILDTAATAHAWGMQRYHRPGSWAFMDMLEAGNAPLTLDESLVQVALWAVMAQPFHLGNDVRNMSAILNDVLTDRRLLSIVRDPLGKMGSRVSTTGGALKGLQVWSRELADASRVVALLNANDPGSVPLPVTVALSDIGLNPVAATVGYDIFRKIAVNITNPSYTARVPPHAVCFMHFQQ